jgi:hypothetical protein
LWKGIISGFAEFQSFTEKECYGRKPSVVGKVDLIWERIVALLT